MDPTQINADSENKLLRRNDEESRPSSLKFKSSLMSFKLTGLSEFFRSLKTKNTSVDVSEVETGFMH